MVSRMILLHAHRMAWNAHANVPQIHIVAGAWVFELRHDMVFIGKADPLACGIPHMNMRTAAQRARGKWGYEVTRIQIENSFDSMSRVRHPSGVCSYDHA